MERERERFVSELRGFLEIKQKSLRFELNYDDDDKNVSLINSIHHYPSPFVDCRLLEVWECEMMGGKDDGRNVGRKGDVPP